MFAKLGFEWGERRRIFLTSWRVIIIRWSLETHSTSKIASEEDESHSRIKYLFFEKTDVSHANSTLLPFISGLPQVYDVSGPSLWLHFHSSLIRVKGCYGCLKTVWLLSTEHLDHWQGSYMHAYQQYQKLDRRIFVI